MMVMIIMTTLYNKLVRTVINGEKERGEIYIGVKCRDN